MELTANGLLAESQATEPTDWQARCGVQKLLTDGYYSGVACLAMVGGVSFETARRIFVEAGLGVGRPGRPAFSTNISEMRMAVAMTGLLQQTKRWRGWDDFSGLGILKMKADWCGAPGKWYWATAFRHPLFEIVVFDPHVEYPAFKRMPLDVLCTDFEIYEPRGQWLQIEQRISLIR